MLTFINFLFRLFLVAAGLVFAAGLAVVAASMLALWGLRAAWARMTGKPAIPFIVRIDPRRSFANMNMHRRRTQQPRPAPGANALRPAPTADVSDVEPRMPQA
jgi:hypothetical protein